MNYQLLLLVLLTYSLAACRANASLPPAPTPSVTQTQTSSPTVTATGTATATPSPRATLTPEPYWQYQIDYLRSRMYGGKALEITESLGGNSAFTRHYFRYDSDGLSIYGFANLPRGEGPFPVIIALHGYIEPEIYRTLDYTTHYADALASAGYLVLHPNLRGYPPSDEGDNLFRVGMAIDVLNLIALVREDSGEPGLLQSADPGRIGMWGHSMGGGIITRVLTVSRDIDAAVLYAAMTGDELKNYEAIYKWSNYSLGSEELAVPQETLQNISPMNFFSDITAPISIHHGLADLLVPVQWSMHTCEQLKALSKEVECHYYEGMPHTFYGAKEKQFIRYTIQFFDRYLQTPQE